MCNIKCSVVTVVTGVVLVVISCVVSFIVVPSVIENIIIGVSYRSLQKYTLNRRTCGGTNNRPMPKKNQKKISRLIPKLG